MFTTQIEIVRESVNMLKNISKIINDFNTTEIHPPTPTRYDYLPHSRPYTIDFALFRNIPFHHNTYTPYSLDSYHLPIALSLYVALSATQPSLLTTELTGPNFHTVCLNLISKLFV